MQYDATVVITTKDRKAELQQAIASVLAQDLPVELLVYDDGSSDGTAEMVRRTFPSVRVERGERPLGIVAARNRAIPMARGPIVFLIDDDCVFSAPDTIRTTLADFSDPRIAAVAIPHINVNSSPAVVDPAPGPGVYVTSEFAGGSHAVRREVFVRLGGYGSGYWRQCEEYDFCTRLLAHGYVTRCGAAAPILHRESPRRNEAAIAFHRARGHLVYTWQNVPAAALTAHAATTVFGCARHAFRKRQLWQAAKGFAGAISDIAAGKIRRSAVSWRAYRLMRRLRAAGPLELATVEPSLPREGAEPRGDRRMCDCAIIHNHWIHYKDLLFHALLQVFPSFKVLFTAESSSVRMPSEALARAAYSYQVSFRGDYERVNQLHAAIRTWRALSRLQPRVLIVSGWYDGAAWAGWAWGIAHRAPMVLWAESNLFDRRRYFALEAVKKWFVRHFAMAHVYGQSNSDYLRALGMPEDKILIKRAVLDVARFRRRTEVVKDPGCATLLYVGRFSPEKNLEALLKAVQSVRGEKLPRPLKLVLAGYGPLEAHLRKLAAEWGLQDSVSFTGAVEQERLPELYSRADAFVLPSMREAWGLVVNEAMCCELPVAVSDRCGCAGDLVTAETGWVFRAHNPDDMVRVVRQIALTTPERLAEMGVQAREISVQYSAENCALRVSESLRRALAETGGAYAAPKLAVD